MHIADRFRQRRIEYGRAAGLEDGYSQSALADAAGVSQGHYCQYESKGARATRAPLSRVVRMAAFYGVPLAEAFPEWRPTLDEREQLVALRSHAGV